MLHSPTLTITKENRWLCYECDLWFHSYDMRDMKICKGCADG